MRAKLRRRESVVLAPYCVCGVGEAGEGTKIGSPNTATRPSPAAGLQSRLKSQTAGPLLWKSRVAGRSSSVYEFDFATSNAGGDAGLPRIICLG
jgi:hypothetical protein